MQPYRNTQSTLTNNLTRLSGMGIFLVTVGYFLYALNTLNRSEFSNVKNADNADKVIYAFLPILVFGLIGLYIAWVGEEPDPEKRRHFRKRGLIICLIGIAEIIGGIVLCLVLIYISFLVGIVGFVEVGTIVLAIATIFFGLLTIALGRDPKTLGWKGTAIERLEKEHGRPPRKKTT